MDSESSPENHPKQNDGGTASAVQVKDKPKTMAGVLKSSGSDERQKLEESVYQMLGKIKSVFYYISNKLNRKLVIETFRKNFKSLAFENYRFYEVDGVKFIVLEVGLFTNSPNYAEDLANSFSVCHKNVILQSISDDKLDQTGRFIPRPERKILVSGLGLYDLTPETLKKGFDGVVEFGDNPRIVLLGDRNSSRFSGEAIVEVKNFLNLPKPDFDFKIEGGFQRIKVKSFGFSKKMLENMTKDCYRCGKVGHLAADCPSRPKVFSWDCTVCGTASTKFGCTVRKCMKAVATVGERVTANMYEAFKKDGIKKSFGIDTETWVTVEPKIKLVEPSAAQIMLAIKNSSCVRDKLLKGEYDRSYELLQRWITLKVDEYGRGLKKS